MWYLGLKDENSKKRKGQSGDSPSPKHCTQPWHVVRTIWLHLRHRTPFPSGFQTADIFRSLPSFMDFITPSNLWSPCTFCLYQPFLFMLLSLKKYSHRGSVNGGNRRKLCFPRSYFSGSMNWSGQLVDVKCYQLFDSRSKSKERKRKREMLREKRVFWRKRGSFVL